MSTKDLNRDLARAERDEQDAYADYRGALRMGLILGADLDLAYDLAHDEGLRHHLARMRVQRLKRMLACRRT